MDLFDKIIHKYLRVPYTLHVYRESKIAKPTATVVFLHGIGNSGLTWDEVSEGMPDDVNIIVVDMLGFGYSPRPKWAMYDASTQARALAKTLVQKGIFGKIILVGHSMGSLVAIEFTRRYPSYVHSLVLCSPPIYNLDKSISKKQFFERDRILRNMYELALKKPANIIALARIAKYAKLLSPSFDVTADNIDTYTAALRANILNQSAMHDLTLIKQPTRILYGTLDPFVIGENIESIVASSQNIRIKKFVGGHEVVGKYVDILVHVLNDQIAEAKS